MERIRVYTGGIAAANGYLIKTSDNTYIAIDAPEGFAEWIRSKRPDAKITDLLITHQHFDHVQDAARIKEWFGAVIHAHAPYSADLTLEDYARNEWGMDLDLPRFVVDDTLTTDAHTANWGGLHWLIQHVPGHSSGRQFQPPEKGNRTNDPDTIGDYQGFSRSRTIYHCQKRSIDQPLPVTERTGLESNHHAIFRIRTLGTSFTSR